MYCRFENWLQNFERDSLRSQSYTRNAVSISFAFHHAFQMLTFCKICARKPQGRNPAEPMSHGTVSDLSLQHHSMSVLEDHLERRLGISLFQNLHLVEPNSFNGGHGIIKTTWRNVYCWYLSALVYIKVAGKLGSRSVAEPCSRGLQ